MRDRRKIWLSISLILAVIIIDQIIKVSVKTHMYLGERIEVTDWCQILFTENRGMAFGIEFFKGTFLENFGKIFLSAFRMIAIGFIIWNLFTELKNRIPTGYAVCWCLIISGAVGNMIDSMFYGLIFSESAYSPAGVATWVALGEGYDGFMMGKVVDMFYFPLFDWTMPDIPLLNSLSFLPEPGSKHTFFSAIFNFADTAISVGIVSLLLFYRKSLSRRFAQLNKKKGNKEQAGESQEMRSEEPKVNEANPS